MRNDVVFNNKNTITVNPDEMLKVTTLLYLQDALLNEEYEKCAELVRTAKEFGARQSEVKRVLIGYNRRVGVRRTNEANQKKGGRRRF